MTVFGKADGSRLAREPSRQHFRGRLPKVLLWLGGALGWGVAMSLSFLASLYIIGRPTGSHDSVLLLLYFTGAVLGWLVALPLIWHVPGHRPTETKFAAGFLLLGVATIGATAGLFALEYRLFYAQWHAPFLSRIWMFQFVFTSASAVYQFAVLGLPHYLPFGFGGLAAVAGLLAAHRR